MYIAYFDEAGDDGYPKYSSDFFILTSIYMHNQEWKNNFKKIEFFRKKLKEDYNFPVKFEFHTKDFLTDKNPYRDLNLTNEQRKEILYLYFDLISLLDIKIINVVINKRNITRDDYEILETAMTYNIQRIENDLKNSPAENKFLIITDEGRLKKMTSITRKIQKINIIPSKFNQSSYIRNEIEKLIEDPLPKKSTESYFIQIADAVSYIVYLHALNNYITDGKWAARVKNVIKEGEEKELLDKIKNVINLRAGSNEYGIVHYPR